LSINVDFNSLGYLLGEVSKSKSMGYLATRIYDCAKKKKRRADFTFLVIFMSEFDRIFS
jgi:hypothetical protein